MLPKIEVLKQEARIRLDRLAEIRDMDVKRVNVQIRDEMASLVSELETINRDIAAEKSAMKIDEQFRSADSGQVVIAKSLPLDDPMDRRSAMIYKNDEFKIPAEGRSNRGNTMSKFKDAGDFFRSVASAGSPAGQTDARLFENRAAGLNESVGSQGGFLIDSPVSTEIFKRAAEMYPLISMCRKFQVAGNSNSIRIPAVDEQSRVDGSRSGGVTSAWISEGSEITGSKPKLRQMEIKLNKLSGLCYASDELLSDAGNAGRFIVDAFSDEIGFKIQNAIIRGDGAGKPQGILESPALITQAAENGQISKTIVFENIQKMWMRLHPSCRKNAVWLINSDIEQQLYSMSLVVGTGGVPVWMPAGGLSQGGFSSLFGRPIFPVEQASTLGTVGDIMLVDLSQYGLLEKNGLDVAQSIHVRFQFDEMCFRFIYRCGGQSLWQTALTPANGTLDQSPFITLATRA